ncbi:hypothetical protein chiPu_0011123, partial [Chiloscyllium punctatum]|nr:hypothetical protein [Chiloscyllium punctatum]
MWASKKERVQKSEKWRVCLGEREQERERAHEQDTERVAHTSKAEREGRRGRARESGHERATESAGTS